MATELLTSVLAELLLDNGFVVVVAAAVVGSETFQVAATVVILESTFLSQYTRVTDPRRVHSPRQTTKSWK